MVIFKKHIFIQVIRKVEGKTEIIAIFHRLKDVFENFINSSDVKSQNMLKLANKEPCSNIRGFKNPSIKPKLDKITFDRS